MLLWRKWVLQAMNKVGVNEDTIRTCNGIQWQGEIVLPYVYFSVCVKLSETDIDLHLHSLMIKSIVLIEISGSLCEKIPWVGVYNALKMYMTVAQLIVTYWRHMAT